MNLCSICLSEYEHEQEHVCPISLGPEGSEDASNVHGAAGVAAVGLPGPSVPVAAPGCGEAPQMPHSQAQQGFPATAYAGAPNAVAPASYPQVQPAAPRPYQPTPQVSAPAPYPAASQVAAPGPYPAASQVAAPGPYPAAPQVAAPGPYPAAPQVAAPTPYPPAPQVAAPRPYPPAPQVAAPAPYPPAPQVAAPGPYPPAPHIAVPQPVQHARLGSTAQAGALSDDQLEVRESVEDTLDMKFHVEMPQDPNVGKTIADRYSILEVVGRGGMGVVYKAEQKPIDRLVAIKMLHPHIVADAETIKRFHKEAQAVSRVEHAHSVRIYDFGITDQAQPFIVMDFVDGGSLRDVLRKESILNLKRAEDIYSQVVEALVCAHGAGIIHRDMKPENIMLCEKSGKPDFVYVVDFGISMLDAGHSAYMAAQTAGETRGSPAYMSPEQCCKGAEIDHRTDIYSLAVSVYETLTGRLPYNARNAFELLDAHKNAAPIPLAAAHSSLSPCESLSAVLLKALEKNPDKRQQTMEEFGMELSEAFKKDSIRQGYLKNRVDTLSTAAPVEAFVSPAQVPVVTPESLSPETSGAKRFLGDPVESGVRMVKSMIQSISKGPESEPEDDQRSSSDNRILFSHCPRCNEPAAPGILFCLACGRSLATTHEFAKIRAAQGVFTLPKAQDSSTSYTTLPKYSGRTRSLASKSSMPVKWMILLAVIGITAAGVYLYSNKLPVDTMQSTHKR